jgi:hypothetical protein
MVAAADTVVRKPIAIQNNSSVLHQALMSDVAMTAVAQPLTTLTAAVADAGNGPWRLTAGKPTARGVARGM